MASCKKGKLDITSLLKQASRVYTHFGCLPVPSKAILRTNEVEGQLTLQTRWSQTDPARCDKTIIEQNHLLCHTTSAKLLFSTPPQPISLGACFPYADNSTRQLWDIECGKKTTKEEGDEDSTFIGNGRLLMVEYKLPPRALADLDAMKATAPTPGTFAHIINASSGRRIKTIKLPTTGEKALHGCVYPSNDLSTPFSACRSSFDGRKIVYLAEALPLKTEIQEEKSTEPSFVYSETWGEGLEGIKQPVMCTIDLTTENIECLSTKLIAVAGPEAAHWSCDEPLWTPNGKGLVFVAYDNHPYPLGLIYCYQRPAKLYYWNMESEQLVCLSRENRAVRWPRFNLDGSRLIWFEVPAGGPHGQCFELVAINWTANSVITKSAAEVIIPLIARPSEEAGGFPGLFISRGLPERCFRLDGKTLLLSTDWGTNEVLLAINVSSITEADNQPDLQWPNRIKHILPNPLRGNDEGAPAAGGGSTRLIDVLNDVVVVQVSSPSVPPFLAVATLPISEKIKRSKIQSKASREDPPLEWLKLSLGVVEQMPVMRSVSWKVIQHKAIIPDARFGVDTFESIFITTTDSFSLQLVGVRPEFDSEKHPHAWNYPVGVIVIPHGGPHSGFTAEWMSGLMGYLACGFACLLVNYRGSTGYGNAAVHSLPGQCGQMDVADCVQATKDVVDPLKLPCVLFGGSHGGFLALHLACRHEAMFKAVVARNPVTNLASMLGTSDIPDWCWEEAGLAPEYARISFVKTPAKKEAKSKSPITEIVENQDSEHPELSCRAWIPKSLSKRPADLQKLANASPISYITSDWSIPLLMCLGAKDQRVPNSQGIEFVRKLRAHLGNEKADKLVQVLRFPCEAHPIESPAAAKENFMRAVELFYKSIGLQQN